MSNIQRIIRENTDLTITYFKILDQIRLIAQVTIKPPSQDSLPNLLKYLNSHMKELIEKFDPFIMAIEDTFYSINVKSALLLGQARGVLLLAAASMEIPSASYAPRKVKQSVAGNGAADKKQVQYMVQHILNMVITKFS